MAVLPAGHPGPFGLFVPRAPRGDRGGTGVAAEPAAGDRCSTPRAQGRHRLALFGGAEPEGNFLRDRRSGRDGQVAASLRPGEAQEGYSGAGTQLVQ